MRHLPAECDVCVVGGGLAGLTAAALLAGRGRRVTLLERSGHMGGRAITHVQHGFHLNLGPHAWYIGGPGTAVLTRLGIPLPGRAPAPAGAFALRDGRLHTLPMGFVSLLTTDLLAAHGKLEAARVLGRILRADTSRFDAVPLADWLREASADARARDVIAMFVRVAMYADAAPLLSAGASLAALASVLRHNVRYLDGGWQVVVDALVTKAAALGARLVPSAPAHQLLVDDAVRGVRLEDGSVVRADSVVLAVPPEAAARLLPQGIAVPRGWQGVPARAASLDLGLARLPKPSTTAAFGVDRPLYYSVHSATAAVAPPGAALVHVAKYLDPAMSHDAAADRAELEAWLDLLQPGWRAQVVVERYLPAMTVVSAIPLAASGGLRGRPGVAVDGVAGLFVAGDWVGGAGTLAQASVASAAEAARLITGENRAGRAAARGAVA